MLLWKLTTLHEKKIVSKIPIFVRLRAWTISSWNARDVIWNETKNGHHRRKSLLLRCAAIKVAAIKPAEDWGCRQKRHQKRCQKCGQKQWRKCRRKCCRKRRRKRHRKRLRQRYQKRHRKRLQKPRRKRHRKHRRKYHRPPSRPPYCARECNLKVKKMSRIVKERILVSDSKVLIHLGFFGNDPRDTRPKIYVSFLHWPLYEILSLYTD